MIKFIKKLLKKKESPINFIGKTENIVTPVKNSDFLPPKEAPKVQPAPKAVEQKNPVQPKKTDGVQAKKSPATKKPGRPKGQSAKPKTDKK
jgi:hypothetical protein